MTQVFGEHIGRTVEAYVDDIVVNSRKDNAWNIEQIRRFYP